VTVAVLCNVSTHGKGRCLHECSDVYERFVALGRGRRPTIHRDVRMPWIEGRAEVMRGWVMACVSKQFPATLAVPYIHTGI
jgi:hypothetical protein